MKRKNFIVTITYIVLCFGCDSRGVKQTLETSIPIYKVSDTLIEDSVEIDSGVAYMSTLDNNKIVVKCNQGVAQKKDYIAEHQSGVSETDEYAKQREVNKGQIYFPCMNKRIHDYKIEKGKIINIVSIIGNTYDDRIDYVFTTDTIFEIDIYSTNAGIFTFSSIKFMSQKVFFNTNDTLFKEECRFNDHYFKLVLNFCKKERIKYKL